MIRELMSFFRVVVLAYKWLAAAWLGILLGLVGVLHILTHSPEFQGVRDTRGPVGFWIGMTAPSVVGVICAFAGLLGFAINSVQRRNWMRQLPFSTDVFIAGPHLLLLLVALFAYLAVPLSWSMGSTGHSLPGTYLFVFSPFLTFYLVRNSKRATLSFAVSLLLVPVLFVLFFELALTPTLRSWWMEHVWNPWVQVLFLVLTFGLAVGFDSISKKALMLLAVSLGVFSALIFLRPPFDLMKPLICNAVIRETEYHRSEFKREYYLYTQQEYQECKDGA